MKLHKRSWTVALVGTWVSFARVWLVTLAYLRLVGLVTVPEIDSSWENTSFPFPSDVLTPLVGADGPESYHSLIFGVSGDSVFSDVLFSLL